MTGYGVVMKARSESILVAETLWVQFLGEGKGKRSSRSDAIRCSLRQTSILYLVSVDLIQQSEVTESGLAGSLSAFFLRVKSWG